MSTIVVDNLVIRIPAWVVDLESFRRWTRCDEFPETGSVCYLNGEVWIDMSREHFFSHNQVKNEFNMVLGALVKSARLGRYIPDGMLLTHVAAELSSQPDGIFVSRDSLEQARVRLVEGVQEGYVELEGSPDMVLEVISTSSVEKDKVLLRDLYWRAGIREYWLVDARGETLQFDILRHAAKGYVASRKQAGWIKSAVLNKSFQLARQNDPMGHPEFTLAVR